VERQCFVKKQVTKPVRPGCATSSVLTFDNEIVCTSLFKIGSGHSSSYVALVVLIPTPICLRKTVMKFLVVACFVLAGATGAQASELQLDELRGDKIMCAQGTTTSDEVFKSEVQTCVQWCGTSSACGYLGGYTNGTRQPDGSYTIICECN
jgi:hypothetical protein